MNFQNPWSRLLGILAPSPDHHAQAALLRQEWEAKGTWIGFFSELLSLPLEAVALFYAGLEAEGTGAAWGTTASDPSWLESYSFVNIKALGNGDRTGTFLDGARILPALRVTGVHLAPFTPCEHRCVYAVASVRSIASPVTDLELEARGFDREWQLAALVQGCHLLGKGVGFDLEPHFTTFSLPVLENPRLFRWIRLNQEKTGLAAPSMEAMLSDQQQEGVAAEVESLVKTLLADSGEPTLEYTREDQRRRREPLHHQIIKTLISRGLWTIPSQYWDGEGIPEFGKMHPQGYPLFICRDRKGVDQRDKALNVVTPLRFDRATDLYAEIFPWWRDRFGFDFVRFDSADHIFDSCDDFDHRRSDRPSPRDLQKAVDRARLGLPGVAALAERMGEEVEDYVQCGFDALLGADMFRKDSHKLASRVLPLAQKLEKLNSGRTNQGLRPITVCVAIDTHDTGDPNMFGAHLLERCTPEELVFRHLLSRFGSAGAGRRPKYEVIGVQDRSTGLFKANVTDASLHWGNDRQALERYHFLEDRYRAWMPILASGSLTHISLEEAGVWWKIESPQGLLVCAQAWGPSGVSLPALGTGTLASLMTCEIYDQTCPVKVSSGESFIWVK